jgi:hypothetical protein
MGFPYTIAPVVHGDTDLRGSQKTSEFVRADFRSALATSRIMATETTERGRGAKSRRQDHLGGPGFGRRTVGPIRLPGFATLSTPTQAARRVHWCMEPLFLPGGGQANLRQSPSRGHAKLR